MASETEIVKYVIPIATFALGFLASRISLSKKERSDLSIKKQELSHSLEVDITKSYNDYISALGKFNNSINTSLDDFIELEKMGAIYFNYLNSLACFVISKNVDKLSVKNSHIQKIKEGYFRTIPTHYKTLNFIAKQCNFEYNGKFKEENYKSMAEVVKKFA